MGCAPESTARKRVLCAASACFSSCISPGVTRLERGWPLRSADHRRHGLHSPHPRPATSPSLLDRMGNVPFLSDQDEAKPVGDARHTIGVLRALLRPVAFLPAAPAVAGPLHAPLTLWMHRQVFRSLAMPGCRKGPGNAGMDDSAAPSLTCHISPAGPQTAAAPPCSASPPPPPAAWNQKEIHL